MNLTPEMSISLLVVEGDQMTSLGIEDVIWSGESFSHSMGNWEMAENHKWLKRAETTSQN